MLTSSFIIEVRKEYQLTKGLSPARFDDRSDHFLYMHKPRIDMQAFFDASCLPVCLAGCPPLCQHELCFLKQLFFQIFYSCLSLFILFCIPSSSLVYVPRAQFEIARIPRVLNSSQQPHTGAAGIVLR